ncbi:glycosyltransferase family 2 protein [[Limnothrix rosea] IAM M-220]|uniref:glycosyltransferase family 2 protein n=1 Tax=[Limnothrix rosea] IAM M-220 TaxID=454133 RepID=UPI0009640A18|nr:glycosyltransferase family 2 protein [[Limnothrix rosea] IAM M-220]OKH19904.1 glycosyltransferase [[Limnothrix rosea] IAM M-220]
MAEILPISALIPTRNRAVVFRRTLESLGQQSVQPDEIVVVDGSDDESTAVVCREKIANLETKIRYFRADKLGAAVQRNQAIAEATQEVIWLLDDDILLEPECLQRLWTALHSDPKVGGVNAMITNQKYTPPGRISRLLYEILSGQKRESYAGQCLGPALNLLPEDREELPEVVPVDWLNTTCVLYRREALPEPLFPSNFRGYSLMEDVTLSLTVGKKWQLLNARTARIFHDSQPGDHKNSQKVLAQMDLVNRHFVMTKILERRQLSDYFKLTLLQLFSIAALFGSQGNVKDLPAVVSGKIAGLFEILNSTKTQKHSPS